MITLSDYFMGRDNQFAAELTVRIREDADVTVARANTLLAMFGEKRRVNSGWRPAAVNASTPGAALRSKHMTGEAIDLEDADGDLDDWLMSDAGQLALTQIGLWHEHPSATKGWAHVQTVPPKSGKRTFWP